MKNTKKAVIDGVRFEFGYMADTEFSGPVFAMYKNGEWHGVLLVDENHREIGWNSGLYATDEELAAIKKARAQFCN